MIVFGEEHDRKVLEYLRDRGLILTRKELKAERKAAFATIRMALHLEGFEVPDSDEELFHFIQGALEGK